MHDLGTCIQQIKKHFKQGYNYIANYVYNKFLYPMQIVSINLLKLGDSHQATICVNIEAKTLIRAYLFE